MGLFLETLKPVVANHVVVQHPFLRAFGEGRLTLENVQMWATEQFFFSISLPSCFAAIYARIPDQLWKMKRALVELLDVEAWGATDTEAHSNHFAELCRFLGLDIEAMNARKPREYTQQYCALRLDLCLNRDRRITEGLAAIALGNEALNLHIFRSYREGIGRVNGCEECPTGYFDAHLRDEGDDFRVFAGLFDALEPTAEDRDAARAGLLELLNARMTFFDTLYGEMTR